MRRPGEIFKGYWTGWDEISQKLFFELAEMIDKKLHRIWDKAHYRYIQESSGHNF
jgi:hypothetical protein